MWKLKHNLNSLLIPKIDGMDFICKTPIYIPFKKIGINALVRKETPLPLEEEMILKLLQLKYKKVSDISKILGVEEDILNDILGEMSLKDLIYVKGEVITITPKGETALKKLTQLIIKHEIISLYIDGITGDFADVENGKNKIPKFYPCLDNNIIIDETFLKQKSTEIERKYKEIQSAYNISSSMVSNNQIYQLLDIDYETTEFVEKNLLIYKNCNDEDYFYEVGSNDQYSNAVLEQIKYASGMKSLLRSRTDVEKYSSVNACIEKSLIDNFNTLNDYVRKDEKEIDEIYFTDRLMLNKEYIEILIQAQEIKPEKIIITTSSLDTICTNSVINTLHNISDKIPVNIVYNESDFYSNKIAQNIIKNNKGSKKIQLAKDNDIVNTKIILYPQCYINVDYIPHFISGAYILQEVPTIFFDKDIIKENMAKIEEKYNINGANKK